MLLGTLDSSSELILLASMETLYFPMALMRVTCIQDCIRKVQPARAVMGWERGGVRGWWWTIEDCWGWGWVMGMGVRVIYLEERVGT